jgi:S-adenosylmethionine:tRNA ribosyltransferase-isomerase
VFGPDTPVDVADGLITGWHPPEASHLDLITAVAGRDTTEIAYAEASRHGGYRLHEFGDSALLLR